MIILNKKSIQVVIDKEGNYSIETMEGFSGTSCVEQTQELEVSIGGETVSSEKKPEYYFGDDQPPVTITN